MRSTTLGYILVIIGVMIFVGTGINFITTKKVANIGPIKIDREDSHPIQWSPFVGVVLILGGIGLIRDKKAKDGDPDS